MIEIVFQDQEASQEIERALKTSAQAVFERQGLDKNSEVSILVGADETLRELNQLHRGEDKATDVLSFPNDGENPESQARYLGDIAISLERADAQAKAAGHSLQAEMQLLCIHGMLHLLGYDHVDADKKKAMWAVQNEILDQLGVEMDREKIGAE